MSLKSLEEIDRDKISIEKTKSTDDSRQEVDDSFNIPSFIFVNNFKNKFQFRNHSTAGKCQFDTVLEENQEDLEDKDIPDSKIKFLSDLKEDHFLEVAGRKIQGKWTQRSRSSEGHLPKVYESKDEDQIREKPKRSLSRFNCLYDKAETSKNSNMLSNLDLIIKLNETEQDRIPENPTEEIDQFEYKETSISGSSNSVSLMSSNSFIRKIVEEEPLNDKETDYHEIVKL